MDPKKRKAIVNAIVGVIALAILGWSGYKILAWYGEYREEKRNDRLMEESRKAFETNPGRVTPATPPTTRGEGTSGVQPATNPVPAATGSAAPTPSASSTQDAGAAPSPTPAPAGAGME